MFFDIPEAGERALLVHCYSRYEDLSGQLARKQIAVSNKLDSDQACNSSSSDVTPVVNIMSQEQHSPRVEEFIELVKSSGVTPIYLSTTRRDTPTPRYYIGSGKVDELCDIVCDNTIDVVLFNHELSPSQERNLEAKFQCRVLDRTGLILDIFAQRARSHVGKLQVELAQLEHISTRLVRGWTHLERQKGGIGLRGPGESQLETDRRLLRERIKWINKRLVKVNAQRQQGRKARSKAELPTLALVGYTNAGKSTLFNAMTSSNVYAEDQLFATLDTTLRALELPTFGKVIIADTVGFVRDLPHKLVEAFKATLEEAAEADLLLHVVDAGSNESDEHVEAVEKVLVEIGAGDLPALLVMNKIDELDACPARVEFRDANEEEPWRIWLSAKSGVGVEALSGALVAALGDKAWSGECKLRPGDERLRAKLYESGAVEQESISEAGVYTLQINFRLSDLQRLFAQEGVDFPALSQSMSLH